MGSVTKLQMSGSSETLIDIICKLGHYFYLKRYIKKASDGFFSARLTVFLLNL